MATRIVWNGCDSYIEESALNLDYQFDNQYLYHGVHRYEFIEVIPITHYQGLEDEYVTECGNCYREV